MTPPGPARGTQEESEAHHQVKTSTWAAPVGLMAAPSPASPCPPSREPRAGASTQLWPPQHRAEQNLPCPAGYAPLAAPQDATVLLVPRGTLLAHGHPAVHQGSQLLLPELLSNSSAQPVLMPVQEASPTAAQTSRTCLHQQPLQAMACSSAGFAPRERARGSPYLQLKSQAYEGLGTISSRVQEEPGAILRIP